jgi:hypothetical protein
MLRNPTHLLSLFPGFTPWHIHPKNPWNQKETEVTKGLKREDGGQRTEDGSEKKRAVYRRTRR